MSASILRARHLNAAMADDVRIAVDARRRSRFIGLLLLVSLILNLFALWLPFVVIDAAGEASYAYGLFGSVLMLRDAGMAALGWMVLIFSVIFPFAKVTMLTGLWWVGVSTPGREKALGLVERLGKWSLFDVFLVAILVALTNDQWLITSASLPGLTCFLIAIILSMFAGELLSAGVRSVSDVPAPVRVGSPPAAPESSGPLFAALVVWSGVILVGVLVLPFIQIVDWRLADREFSLLTMVSALWQNQSPILALAVASFVIGMPIIRWLMAAIMVLGWWRRIPPAGMLTLFAIAGRWSMPAVFALSLGIFIAEGHHFLGTVQRAGTWVLVIGLVVGYGCLFLVERGWRRR